MDAPNRLLQAALEIQEFCESRRWRFCFIGGVAVQHWGEVRADPRPLLELKGEDAALRRLQDVLSRHSAS